MSGWPQWSPLLAGLRPRVLVVRGEGFGEEGAPDVQLDVLHWVTGVVFKGHRHRHKAVDP